MLNLSLLCTMTVMFVGVCGMLGYVVSAYQQLRDEHEKLKAEQGKTNSTSVQIENQNGEHNEIS